MSVDVTECQTIPTRYFNQIKTRIFVRSGVWELLLTPKLFEALVEERVDRDLVELARQRLTRKDTAIEVDVDQI